MSKPIVFISHFRIKQGAAEAYRALQREVTSAVHADKPQTFRAAAASSGVGLTLQPELVAGILRLYRSGDGST